MLVSPKSKSPNRSLLWLPGTVRAATNSDDYDDEYEGGDGDYEL